MKKRILLLAFVGFVVQSTFAYSWPQCQNTNGGTPEAPSGTIYIGDSKTFGHDSWGQVDGNDGKWIVVTSKNADLTTNALYGTETGTSNTQHKTANSANFNSTGTWYWGMRVIYPNAGNTTAWYCRNFTSWQNMYGSPTSELTVTVSALSDPTIGTLTSTKTSITIPITEWNSKYVTILRNTTNDFTDPTQGTSYTVGTVINSKATVVAANSNTTSFTDNSLTPGTTYYYKIYSNNNNYYSAGTVQNTTTVAAPVISSISSTPGSATQTYKGATVTITGTTLGSLGTVKLGGSGGTTITIASQSATQITFVVPDATSNGTVYVSDGTDTSTSSSSLSNLGFISTASGNWDGSTTATWLGGSIPTSGSSVTIASPNTVTLAATATVSSLTINTGGTFNNGTAQTLNVSASGSLTNNGTFNGGTGTVAFAGSGTISGTIALNNLTLNGATTLSSATTINGTLLLNSGYSFGGSNSPIYGNSSKLTYNSGGTPAVSLEWTAASGTIGTTAGYPNSIDIQNGTSLTLDAIGTDRGLASNLTLGTGTTSNGSLTMGNTAKKLTVNGSLIIGGNSTSGTSTLTLSTNPASAAIEIGADWTRNTNGVFTVNGRGVFFIGSGNSQITTSSTALIPYLFIQKSVNTATVTLNNELDISNTLGLTKGILVTTASNIVYVTGTASGSITGGSTDSYISGPLKWALPASLLSGSSYIFPVGAASTYLPLTLVNPTTGTGTITLTAQAFNTNSNGSASGTLSSISNSEYWSLASTGNFTNSSVSLTRQSAVSPLNVIGNCTTATGSYTSLAGTASGNSITGSSTFTGASQFFVLANGAIPSISSFSASVNNGTATSGYVGSTVSLTGTGFSSASAVHVGSTNITPFTIENSTSITFTASSGLSGTITVTTPNGTSAASTGSYADLGYITTTTGNWSSTATWLGGAIPPTGANVTIANNTTLNQDATVALLTINGSTTFTASDASPRVLTIAPSSAITSLTNGGSWANGLGGSTVVFSAAAGSVQLVNSTSGTIGFNKVVVNKTGGTSNNVGLTFGSGATVNGTLEIGNGGYINAIYPGSLFWGSSAILKFNTGATYDVPNTDKTWPVSSNLPPNIEITSGTVTLSDPRTSGNLNIDGGTLSLFADLTINGSWTRSSGTFTPGTHKVTLSGSSAQTVDVSIGASMYNLEVNNTAGVNFSTGGLTINDGGTLTLTAGILSFASNYNLTIGSSGSCTINRNAGSLSFGTGGMTSAAANIDLNYTNAADLTTGAEFGTTNTKIRNLTIGSGSGKKVTLANANSLSGTLTISSGATLDVSSSNYGLTFASGGTFANSGTFTAQSGTVTFSGSGTITGTIAFNNITVNGAVTPSTATTINGTLQINSGGSISTNSPIYGNSSSLIYYDTSTNISAPTTVGIEWPSSGPTNVSLSGITGTCFQLNVNRTINGSFSVGTGAQIKGNNNTLTLSGGTSLFPVTFTNNGIMYGEWGGNTLSFVFDGVASLAGTKGYLDAKNYTVNTGKTLDCSTIGLNTNSSSPAKGIVTINGTLKTANSAGLWNGSDNTTTIRYSSGNFQTISLGASSTIEYNAAGSQTVSTSAGLFTGYNNLTISGSGTKTAGGNLTIAGDLNVSAGTLDLATNTANRTSSGGTLTVAGSLNLGASTGGQTGSNFPTNFTTVTLTGGTVNYNKAAGGQTIYAIPTYSTLMIGNTSGTQTLGSNLTVGELTININASLDVSAGKQLTVSTTMSNSGILNLLSTSTDGTSTIITPATITNTSATYNVYQYLSGARNWYMSLPVGGNLPAGNTYYKYDEPGNNPHTPITAPETAYWESLSSGTAATAATGYIVLPSGASTINFTGTTLNTGDKLIGLTRTTGKTKEGFNLIGNPYPSHITMTYTLLNSANLLNTIWCRTAVYDTPNSKYTYSFNTYLMNSDGSTVSSPSGTTGIIPPMQAFWVRLNSAGSGSFTFTNSMRLHQTSNPLKTKSKVNTSMPLLRLEVANINSSVDEAVIYFNSNAVNTLDNYDALKMSNGSVSIPEIFTTPFLSNEQLAINGMTSIPYDTEIPLGFTTGTAGTNFSIKASEISNFDAGTKVLLKDTANVNSPIDISDGSSYIFSSGITNSSTRFAVIFKSASVYTGITGNANQNVWISVNGTNQIVVNGASGAESTVAVYNAVGQKLVAKTLSSSITTLNNPLQSGVYFVTVTNAGKSVTQKVILN